MNLFSCTKGVTNISIAKLVDNGLLNYECKILFLIYFILCFFLFFNSFLFLFFHFQSSAPISNYWPEFSENGKSKITVSQLLSHTAGLPYFDEPITLEMLERGTNGDRSFLSHFLAKQKQIWKNGELGYHAHSVGLFAAELVYRVDPKHRPIHKFFKEEIADKYGLDYHLVLNPESDKRVARFSFIPPNPNASNVGVVVSDGSVENEMRKNQLLEWQSKTFSTIEGFSPFRMRFVECPSSVGFGNARALAKLYGSLSSGDGIVNEDRAKRLPRLLSPKTIEQMTKIQVSGFDLIEQTHNSFCKGGLKKYSYKPGTTQFGHGGYGGSLGWCDLENQIGFGYATATLSMQENDPRRQILIDAVYESLRSISKL